MTLKITQELEQAIVAIANLHNSNSRSIAASVLVDRLETARDKYPHDHIIVNMSESIQASLKNDPFKMMSPSDVQECFNHFVQLGASDNVRSVLGEFLVDHRIATSTTRESHDDRTWGSNITRDLSDVQAGVQPLEVSVRATDATLDAEASRAIFGDLEDEIFGSLSDSVLRKASSFSDNEINKVINFVAEEFSAVVGQTPSVRFASDDGSNTVQVFASLKNGGRDSVFVVDVPIAKQSNHPLPILQYVMANTDKKRLFTAANLRQDMSSHDTSTASISIKYSTMDFNSLIRELYTSASNGENASAKMILDAVRTNYPDKINVAVENLTEALQKFAEREEAPNCSRIIPAGKYSVRDVCGHLRIPLDEVYVDDAGSCRRKSLAVFDSLESSNVSIATSKIHLT